MTLSRILTTFACGVCVPAFLLAGPQSSTTQPGQSSSSSQSSTPQHQHGAISGTSTGSVQDGMQAGQHCQEAQASLDKAFSMYDQLRPGAGSNSSLGTSSSSSSYPSSTSSSSSTQPGSSTSGSASSTQPGSTAQPDGRTQSGISNGSAAGTTDGVASWDNFRVQLDHARTHLRYCMNAMNQMHGQMQNGMSNGTSGNSTSGSTTKDPNKPQQ